MGCIILNPGASIPHLKKEEYQKKEHRFRRFVLSAEAGWILHANFVSKIASLVYRGDRHESDLHPTQARTGGTS